MVLVPSLWRVVILLYPHKQICPLSPLWLLTRNMLSQGWRPSTQRVPPPPPSLIPRHHSRSPTIPLLSSFFHIRVQTNSQIHRLILIPLLVLRQLVLVIQIISVLAITPFSSTHLQKSVRFEKHIVHPLLAAVAKLQIGHHSKVVQLLLNLPHHFYQKANRIVQSSVRRLYDEHNSKYIRPSFCCIRYRRESPSGKRNLLMSRLHGNHLSSVSCVTRSHFVRIYGIAKTKQRTFRWGRPSCSIDDNAIRLPDMYLDSSEMKGQSIYDEHPLRTMTR